MSQPPLDVPLTAPRLAALLDRTHVNLEVEPDGDGMRAYRLVVPRSWPLSASFGPVPDGPFEPRGLGFLAGGAARHAPVIAVTVTPVLFEIPVDVWLEATMRGEGWEIASARWVPGPHGIFFDVAGTRTDDGVPLVRRSTARSDGPRIFCVNTFCAREQWNAMKESFLVAHMTFEPVAGSGQVQMEPWRAAGADEPAFRVSHPASWSAEVATSARPGVSAVDLRLAGANDERLLAYLQVNAHSEQPGRPTPLDALEARALGALRRAGVVMRSALRPLCVAEDPRAAAVPGWLGGAAGQAHLGGADVDVRVGFVRRQGTGATFTMVSPRLEDDVLVNLRATRSFEIARDTLELR